MRRIVILTQGHSDPNTAKTAASVIRYGDEEVLALLDDTQIGRTAGELLGVGDNIPVVGHLDDVPTANTLLIGIAIHGGRIPEAWRPIILTAIRRGMNIVSGLHEFLSDDVELVTTAREHGAQLLDIRKNDHQQELTRDGYHTKCLRIHTVGNDCNVGKLVTSIELTKALKDAGHDAKLVATGQTGIMIEGDGCPIDAVVSDFVNGAAEQLVIQNQHHDILVIEGQGSIAHPRFSAVTLGLLHGCVPHGLIVCCEVGRTHYRGLDVRIPPLAKIIQANKAMASLIHPCKVIGVAVNCSKVSAAAAETEKTRLREQLGLPVCDVVMDGPQELVSAVLKLRDEVRACN